jgi:aspartate aminotransferase
VIIVKDMDPAQIRLSSRLDGIDLSEIVRLSEKAARLRAEGLDIIALSTGEPDLPTPARVVEAAHVAAMSGQTRYTATAGTAELRDAIARGAGVARENTIVSTGAKQVIANAMLATLDPGDEVIMPAPFWTSYADMVRLASGIPVIVPCQAETGFKLSATALRAAITPRTRWLMLNSPSNPSGAVYSEGEIREIAHVLESYPQVMLLSDEIYRELAFVPFASAPAAAPALADRTLVVDGVSKAWSMTGWRIGWGIGPAPLISAMTKVQGQITSGASSISQAGVLSAITGDRGLLEERRTVFRARRDRVVAALNTMPGLTCFVPDGAFYAFPSCHGLLQPAGGPFASDAGLCAWLLEAAAVAVVPGRAFGLPGHLRLSFACSDTDLDTALTRMRDAFLERIPR